MEGKTLEQAKKEYLEKLGIKVDEKEDIQTKNCNNYVEVKAVNEDIEKKFGKEDDSDLEEFYDIHENENGDSVIKFDWGDYDERRKKR